MSVQSELDRIISAIGAAYDAVEAKGGTVPQSETVAGLAAAVQSIQTGGGEENLFHATITPATAGEVVTVELADHPCNIKAIVVRTTDVFSGIKRNPIYAIAVVLSNPPSDSGKSVSTLGQVIYCRESNSSNGYIPNYTHKYTSDTSGDVYGNCFHVWHGTAGSRKPWIKMFTSDGTDNMYGLLVGTTYDVWAIF